jgi:ribosomal protein S18 acetylase RimI-like enzyme
VSLQIRPFVEADEPQVVDLWQRCGLVRPWNDPRKDIARKLGVQRELFLVGVAGDRVVATVMAGYEGHRGWINYLAVDPASRRQGVARALMAAVEDRLRALGCAKINLQIRADNRDAIAFYNRLGFAEDAAVSMGKRLERDD